MTYSTRAIILRRRDVGEWNRFYTAYTRERGKLTLVGIGTRRSAAKLTAHLEPYSDVELTVANGRAIDRITAARVHASGVLFTGSWEMIRTASFVCECVDQLTREAHRDPAIFDLLHDTLDGIRGFSRQAAQLINRSTDQPIVPFIIRFFSLLGYAPQVDYCLDCRRSINSESVIGKPRRGGVVCEQCNKSKLDGIFLSPDDCRQIAAASASFQHFSPTSAVASFAQALLESHLVASLQTMSSLCSLTGEQTLANIGMS